VDIILPYALALYTSYSYGLLATKKQRMETNGKDGRILN
jgi:hypothetical protein